MYIQNLMIELTRRCNLSCSHCLRGTAQNCDMNKKYIDELFKKIDSIGILSLTGGEPSLNVEMIEYIIEQLKEKEIYLDSFYIATNGVNVTNEFIFLLIKLYSYCDNQDACIVEISNDGYHIDEIGDIPNSYKMLEALRFVNRRNKDQEYYPVVSEGNGLNFGYDQQLKVMKFYDIDEDSISDILYLNCKGNLLCGCDFSYKNQDHEIMIIGNIMKIKSLYNACKRYNKRIEKLEKESRTNIVNDMIDYYDCYIDIEETEGKAA